jgi:hypothetical protein
MQKIAQKHHRTIENCRKKKNKTDGLNEKTPRNGLRGKCIA